MKAKAKAHTNIALIKYWGKRDEKLFLPMNSSISITLDQFYTVTTVEFNEAYRNDSFFLNNKQASEDETRKMSQFLQLIRHKAGKQLYAKVDSMNHVPTAAGFASSASGYAALAAAATKALGLDMARKELSQIARQGSGSASRSLYGGFVEWQKGEKSDGSDSYAKQLMTEDAWDLSVLSVLVESKQKKVLSREGMKRTVDTSPFYSGWLHAVEKDLNTARNALEKKDFKMLGSVMESNALKMHATTLGADPPFLYWQSSTLEVMEKVQELRAAGIAAYFTIDAGPNVKVLCERKDEQTIYDTLVHLPSVKQVIPCHPGPGISYL